MLRQARMFLLLLLALYCYAAVEAQDSDSHSEQHYHDIDGDGEDEHDPVYDQEQFLGKDMAKKFAEYDTAVSSQKLAELVKNEIDLNKDDFVTEDELVQRLEKVNKQQQDDDIETHWRDLDQSDGDRLNWTTYTKSLQPSFFDLRNDSVAKAASEAVELAEKGVDVISIPFPEKGTEDERQPLMEFFKDLVKKRKRWAVADANKDGVLSREEFRSMLFPEDVPAMRDLLLSETMDQLDTDKDGRLTLDEYLAGQWNPTEPGEKEPHWLAEEREAFKKKDANADGFIDREEGRAWLQPPSTLPDASLKEEAKHIIKESDDDGDGKLSAAEMEKHRELFAGSKATRYGEDVMTEPERHDEL